MCHRTAEGVQQASLAGPEGGQHSPQPAAAQHQLVTCAAQTKAAPWCSQPKGMLPSSWLSTVQQHWLGAEACSLHAYARPVIQGANLPLAARGAGLLEADLTGHTVAGAVDCWRGNKPGLQHSRLATHAPHELL